MSGRGAGEERVRRIVSLLFGVAAVVFGLISLGAILDQRADAPPWWTAVALAAILGTAVVLGVAAPLAPLLILRPLAAAVVVGYALVAATMPFAVLPSATSGAAPWPLGLTALGTTAAALAFRPAIAWASTAALGISVAVDRVATSGRDLTAIAVQDAAYSVFFGAVFVALTLGALAAARRVDRAAEDADRAAIAGAVSRMEQEERARVDALVHDRVLATLLLAARGLPGHHVRAEATTALDGLRLLTLPPEPSATTSTEDLADRLRNRLTLLTPWAALEVTDAGGSKIPGSVADALLGAAGEALRNAVRHAGDASAVAVRLDVEGATVRLTIVDDGVGFDRRAVPPGLLGLASSIEGRMSSAGGIAVVRSRVGAGTAVQLVWPAP